MTWEIVLGIIALFGFCVAVVSPLAKLTTVIITLSMNCEILAKQFKEFGDNNTESHKRLWQHNEKQDEILKKHGERLHDLDGK